MMNHEQQVWQSTAGTLLAKYFGLMLNDTELCEEDCVIALQEAGIRPFEAINTLVDKYHLERIDGTGYQPLSPYIREVDELKILLDAEEECS
ncbi:TA system toxin CbtA family protein [Gibbsiella greigii]